MEQPPETRPYSFDYKPIFPILLAGSTSRRIFLAGLQLHPVPQDEVNRPLKVARRPQPLQPNNSLDSESGEANPGRASEEPRRRLI